VKDYILIAKLTSLFGKEGFIKIDPYFNSAERFLELDVVYVDFWGDKKKLIVEDVKLLNNTFVLKFKNFDNTRESEVFLGRKMYLETKNLVELPEHNYFIHDLIGSKVFKYNDEIGEISDVLSLPANDVIVILSKKQKEILVPLVPDFIDKFEPEKKILILKPEMGFDDED